MEYNLKGITDYWKRVFASENPMEAVLSLENSNKLREIIRKKFDIRYYPEPFYGYLDGDTSLDILFLLLNPGQERVEELKGRFAADTLDESRRLWNESTRDRHLKWTFTEYHAEEQRIYVSEKWRYDRLVAALKILNEYENQYIPPDKCFLHTAEFFPFRSKTFSVSNKWIFELNSTKLLLGALKEITSMNKFRHIFAVSQSWFDILEYENDIFKPNRIMRVTLKKKETDLNSPYFSHRMALYSLTKQATPILVYKAGGSSRMNLPVNETAVRIIRYMLGVKGGELPEHDD
jgi:hypothetical protein